MKSIKVNEKIKNNKFVSWFWQMRAYLDIANGQIGWFTSKTVDAMGVLWVLERIGLVIEGDAVLWFGGIGFALMIIVGVFYKKTGLYDSEREAYAYVNVVQNEKYESAKAINEKIHEIYKAAKKINKEEQQ